MKNEKTVNKVKFPGRVKLICQRCEENFSTHSSNRKVCHKCKPKCKERHYFDTHYIRENNTIHVSLISDGNVVSSITEDTVTEKTEEMDNA